MKSKLNDGMTKQEVIKLLQIDTIRYIGDFFIEYLCFLSNGLIVFEFN
jgi:hypothetical protein